MTSVSELSGNYTIDPAHTTLAFVARHAMITKVRGTLAASGEATLDGSNPDASHITVRADVATVNTGQDGRDEHLRSADFFEVDKHPEIVFQSTAVKVVADDEIEVTGDLQIRDEVRQITIPLEYTGSVVDPFGQTRAGFEGQMDVKRSDFGLTWNAALEAGGVLVSDKIRLEFDVALIKDA